MIWLAMFMPLILCGLLGMVVRPSFLPSSEFLGAMAVSANVIAVILVLPFIAFFPLLFRSSPSWHRWLLPVMPVIMFSFLRNTLLHEVPWVANRFAGSQGELTVTVEKKSDRYYAKRCSGSALVSYKEVREAQLCRLDESLWRSMTENDSLVLSGSSSYFGIDYSNVELEKANKRFQPTLAKPSAAEARR